MRAECRCRLGRPPRRIALPESKSRLTPREASYVQLWLRSFFIAVMGVRQNLLAHPVDQFLPKNIQAACQCGRQKSDRGRFT